MDLNVNNVIDNLASQVALLSKENAILKAQIQALQESEETQEPKSDEEA